MTIDEAIAVLERYGIAPEQLPEVIEAIEVVLGVAEPDDGEGMEDMEAGGDIEPAPAPAPRAQPQRRSPAPPAPAPSAAVAEQDSMPHAPMQSRPEPTGNRLVDLGMDAPPPPQQPMQPLPVDQAERNRKRAVVGY